MYAKYITTVQCWTPEISLNGAISWSCPESPFIIYATPYYDRKDALSIQVNSSYNDGHVLDAFDVEYPFIEDETYWTSNDTIHRADDPQIQRYSLLMQTLIPLIVRIATNNKNNKQT